MRNSFRNRHASVFGMSVLAKLNDHGSIVQLVRLR